MKRIAKLILVLLLFSALSGCATSKKGTIEWSEADARLKKRAAFDLQCEESELETTDLGEIDGLWEHSWTQGVRCGDRQATYLWVPDRGWVMNNELESRPD